MRHLSLLGVLALMSDLPLAAVPQDSPLEGCRVKSAGPPTVHVACGEDMLEVTDATLEERGEAFDEGLILGLREGAKQPVEQVEFSIELGGAKHRAVRLISAGTHQYVIVTLGRAEGRRTIMCREALRPESRCHPRIEAAARWDWRAGPPASVRRDLRSPEVAGRPLALPQGCDFVDGPGGGKVTCSDRTFLAWVEAPAAGTLDPAPIIANFRRLAKHEGTLGCSVEGVLTECWNGTDAEAGVGVYVSHAVVVRGKRLVVVCLQAHRGTGLHQACQSILALPLP